MHLDPGPYTPQAQFIFTILHFVCILINNIAALNFVKGNVEKALGQFIKILQLRNLCVQVPNDLLHMSIIQENLTHLYLKVHKSSEAWILVQLAVENQERILSVLKPDSVNALDSTSVMYTVNRLENIIATRIMTTPDNDLDTILYHLRHNYKTVITLTTRTKL